MSPADRDMVEQLGTQHPLRVLLERIRLTGAVEQVPEQVFVFGEIRADGPFAGYPDRLSGQPGWRVITVHAGANLLLDDPDLVVETLVEQPGPRR